jgi:iron complex transport system ATP-binding protein
MSQSQLKHSNKLEQSGSVPMIQIKGLEAKYPQSSQAGRSCQSDQSGQSGQSGQSSQPGGLVLHGISLQVRQGEFVGLIGPNGSGKSTLLRVITRALPSIRGEVWLMGEDIRSISPRQMAQRLAVVSQFQGGINSDFTGEEFVLLGRTPYLRRWQLVEGRHDLKIAEQSMALTNTIDFRYRKVWQLSGGELQRVLVARALTQQPQLLLLDEVTSHLDINYQLQVFDLLRCLNEERGITILAVLHDLNLAAEYCQRLILLEKGTIFAQGPPHEVITGETIRRVYQARVDCRLDPMTQKPHVFFPSRTIDLKRSLQCRIHVVCGGGSGSEIMRRLMQEGFRVSAGVLNVGDSDEVTARQLGIAVVEEKPFSPICEQAFHQNVAAIASADFILLAPVMIGHGNVYNLQAVVQALKMGKPVVVLRHGSGFGQQFDFTENGEGLEWYQRIIQGGAKVLEDLTGLLPFLAHRMEWGAVGPDNDHPTPDR